MLYILQHVPSKMQQLVQTFMPSLEDRPRPSRFFISKKKMRLEPRFHSFRKYFNMYGFKRCM